MERSLSAFGGFCCETMQMVCKRMESAKHKLGLQAALSLNMRNGESYRQVVCYFPKARKDDSSAFGHGTPHANGVYSPLNYCPWCSTKLTDQKE